MRVKSLDLNEFQEKSSELADAVEKRYGRWQAVVGIASGGQWVAKAFERENAEYIIVESRRKSTRLKRIFADGIISLLPRRICDWLRICEAKASSPNKPNSEFELPDEAVKILKSINLESKADHIPLIVVVDDAADSGNTLLGVKDAVGKITPDCKVVTAVITATQEGGSEVSDIALWRDGVLVRFPWAPDAKRYVRKEFEEWKKRITGRG